MGILRLEWMLLWLRDNDAIVEVEIRTSPRERRSLFVIQELDLEKKGMEILRQELSFDSYRRQKTKGLAFCLVIMNKLF